jgi:hypothetical protein
MLTSLKLILILFVLLLAPAAWGQATQDPTNTTCNESSRLAWNMNTESDLDKYTLYYSNSNIEDSDTGKIAVTGQEDIQHDPTNTTGQVEHTLTLTQEGATWFRLTASDKTGNESPMSNEIGCTLDFKPGVPSISLKFVIQATP